MKSLPAPEVMESLPAVAVAPSVAVARDEGIAVDEDLRLVNVEVDEILAPGAEVRGLDLQPIAILQDFFEVEAERELESLGALRVEVGVGHEAVDHAGADRNREGRAGEGARVNVMVRAEGRGTERQDVSIE